MGLIPKNYIKKRFNVSKWVGASQIKDNATMLKELVKPEKTAEEVIRKQQAKHMSFEELIQVNQWSPSDIEKNKTYQKKMSYGFLIFAGILLLLAIYLFFTGNIFGGIFSLVFMLLGLAYAYQSWVSFEQLKQHKIRINVRASLLSLFKK